MINSICYCGKTCELIKDYEESAEDTFLYECPGIHTALKFDSDDQLIEYSLFLDRDNQRFKIIGKSRLNYSILYHKHHKQAWSPIFDLTYIPVTFINNIVQTEKLYNRFYNLIAFS